MRVLDDHDIQAVLRFFAGQAAAHLARHGSVPPACVLTWLQLERPEVESVHQFPTAEVVELMRTESGKHKLAGAIRTMLTASEEGTDAPRCPHAVVQVLLTALPEGEALLLLAHVPQATYAVALPLPTDGSPLALPATFDLAASRLDIEG